MSRNFTITLVEKAAKFLVKCPLTVIQRNIIPVEVHPISRLVTENLARPSRVNMGKPNTVVASPTLATENLAEPRRVKCHRAPAANSQGEPTCEWQGRGEVDGWSVAWTSLRGGFADYGGKTVVFCGKGLPAGLAEYVLHRKIGDKFPKLRTSNFHRL